MQQVINIRTIVTFCLVVLFFSGGVFLDYTASQRWTALSPDPEANKAMIAYVQKATDNLTASAKVLYDFAKIALGVLLTLLAASNTVARAANPPAERPVPMPSDERTAEGPQSAG